MPTLTPNLVEGSSAVLALGGAQEVTEIYWNSDLDLTGQNTLAQAFTGAIPAIDSAHPNAQFQDLKVSSIRADLAGAGKARVTVRYTIPPLQIGDSLFWVESSLTPQRTNVDRNGDRITTTDAEGNEQGHPVDIGAPQISLRWQQAESSSPISNIQAFLGKLNQSDIYGFTARQLLCTRLDGQKRSAADGGGWLVDYAFSYNPNGWEVEVIATQSDGTYVANPTGDEVTVYEVIGQADFSTLGLEVPV